MVRRRGYYEIQVMGKQLSCPHCDGTLFSHREVYVDVAQFVDEDPKKEINTAVFYV